MWGKLGSSQTGVAMLREGGRQSPHTGENEGFRFCHEEGQRHGARRWSLNVLSGPKGRAKKSKKALV